jgi:hypothetical protein
MSRTLFQAVSVQLSEIDVEFLAVFFCSKGVAESASAFFDLRNHAADEPLLHTSERLIRSQVCPGCTAFHRAEARRPALRHAFENFFVNCPFELFKHLVNCFQIVVKRVFAPQRYPLGAIAQFRDRIEMFSPELIDGGQRYLSLEFRGTRPFPTEDRLPPLLNGLPLPLNHMFIFGKEFASLEVLAFDEPLNALWGVVELGIVDAILYKQVIFERDEELGTARVALASSAPS